MIGVTQLLSKVLNPSPGSETSPFTSHSEVANSGLTDGYYYFNDGNRTRQYYFSVDGTAAGQSTGGWARIDSTSMPSPYSGQECVSGSGTITSDGTIKVRATSNGGVGSTSHGGCGTGYNSTYFKARYISITDYAGSTNTGGGNGWADSMYLYLYDSPTTLRSDWAGNQSGNGSYYYPGAYAFPNQSDPTLSLLLSNAQSYPTTYPSFPATSGATSANYSLNSEGYYRVDERGFDLFNTADRILHVGQSVYQGSNSEVSFKLWFKF